MVEHRKKRVKWAPKREPDEHWPEPPPDDPDYPFWKLVDETLPSLGDRIWLIPECEVEPTLDRWIAAFVAMDQRRDQLSLARLLKSDHPLRRHARVHLANLIARHQEQDALTPLLAKLQSGAELSRDDRLSVANLLDQKPWKKTTGNRPISYEVRAENAALGRAAAFVDDLIDQGRNLKERLDERAAEGMSLQQAIDKLKDRPWSVKNPTLKERVAELKSPDLSPKQIRDKLIGEGWVREDETIKEALANRTLNDLTRQRGWISDESAPDVTVKTAVDELILSEGLTLHQAVTRLTRQRWTTAEAVNRVSKLQNIPRKTLHNYCSKGRPSLRAKSQQQY